MASLFAIDIHDGLVTGVLLKAGPKVSVVKGYGVATVEEGALYEAVAEVAKQAGFENGDCRVAIGAENCSFRKLVLPFSDRQKIEQVLPFELEEIFSLNSEELQIDFLMSRTGNSETSVLAAMVDRAKFVDTLAVLQSRNIDPEIYSVSGGQVAACIMAGSPDINNFLLLDIGLKRVTLILVEGRQISLVRSLPFDTDGEAGFRLQTDENTVAAQSPDKIPELMQQLGVLIHQTLLSVQRAELLKDGTPCFVCGCVGLHAEIPELISEILNVKVQLFNPGDMLLLKIESTDTAPWNPTVMSRALALAVYNTRESQIFNFRKGDFRKKISLKNLRKVILMASLPLCLICIVAFGLFWREYLQLKDSQEKLRDQINDVFREALPEVTRIVNPLQQLQIKIEDARDTYRTGGQGDDNIRKVALLTEISARIPESLPIRITRFVADRDDVRIKGQTKDFNTVDNVKKELEKSDYFTSVSISSANLAPKGGNVRFELKLVLR